MRRRKSDAKYDDATIQMLDSINFQPTPTFSSRSGLADTEEVYSLNTLKRALNVSLEKKCLKIERFLEKNNSANFRSHLSQLYSFATSHDGLVKDAYREKIWPILAENIPVAPKIVKEEKETSSKRRKDTNDNADASTSSSEDSDFESALSTFSSSSQNLEDVFGEEFASPSMEELRCCKDWNQVELDVNRTVARFPPNINEDERQMLQTELTPLIVQIMWENPKFSYYQGFHDVCLTLILVMGKDQALKAARCLTRRAHFYNYLSSTLEESAMTELQDVYVLLYLHDPDVEQHMRFAELGALFALSWPLTWFSHIVIFFDLFLSSHHMMPIYVAAALISERRQEVLQCEAEMPMLHSSPNINVNKILDSARLLFARFPPALVQGEYKREYEKMCARQRRQRLTVARLQQRIPPPGTLPRNNLSPWLVAGTAVSAVALYLWVARTINPAHMF